MSHSNWGNAIAPIEGEKGQVPDTFKLRTIRDIIYRWAPPNENGTLVYIRSVAERTGINADSVLGDPATHAAQWLMIGMAMAIVENGTTQQDYLSMLKGWEMAMS